MRIAVVGAGAMGSVYAGLLADAGNEVWAVDVWKEHVDAINERGLRVEGASGDRTVRLKATTEFKEVGPCELVIIATKAGQVGEAARSIEPMVDDKTLILTIQYGLGAAERICQYRSPDGILIGVAGGFGASIKGPGHVHHNGMELIRLGEMKASVSERLEKITQLWRDAGFNVKAFSYEAIAWSIRPRLAYRSPLVSNGLASPGATSIYLLIARIERSRSPTAS